MKKNVENRRFVATCIACGLKFRAIRHDCLFCDKRCYKRNRRCVLGPTPRMGARELPLTRAAIDIRESVLRAASHHAEYYTATSVDLQVAFPLPNDTVRSSGLAPTMPFYKLEPFEFPMVPLVGLYAIHYLTGDGLAVAPQDRRPTPELLITFTFPLRRSAPADLRAGVRQLLTDRKPRLALPGSQKKRLALPSPQGATAGLEKRPGQVGDEPARGGALTLSPRRGGTRHGHQ